MNVARTVGSLVMTGALLMCARGRAEELDVSKLYTLSTDGSSTHLKPGAQGKLVISITTKEKSHISDEAPISVKLEAKNVTLTKSALTAKDSQGVPAGGKVGKDPHFEVPFTAGAKGDASVDGKVIFFVCTEKLCLRQQKTVSVPVTVG